jgi:hypothetical protein
MDYKTQLQQKEWKDKRLELLEKDSFRCSNCLNRKYVEGTKKGIVTPKQIERKNDFIQITPIGYSDFLSLRLDLYGYDISDGYFVAYIDSVKNENDEVKTRLIALRPIQKVEILMKSIPFDKISNQEFFLQMFGHKGLNELNSIEIESSKWSYCFNMHIHHKYYQDELLAWQYPLKAYETLCWDCHEELHKNHTIPHYDKCGELVDYYHRCKRCYASGWFPQFSHIRDGVCFNCEGERFEELIEIN